jgi:hypothetical protein
MRLTFTQKYRPTATRGIIDKSVGRKRGRSALPRSPIGPPIEAPNHEYRRGSEAPRSSLGDDNDHRAVGQRAQQDGAEQIHSLTATRRDRVGVGQPQSLRYAAES